MANILTAGNSSNGGTAISTDTSGTLNIVTGSGSGANAITIDASQNVVFANAISVAGSTTITGALAVTGSITASGGVSGGITRGTAVTSTSGTSIDFTSIPSGVRRITIMFSGVSTSGTSFVIAQLGTGGTPTTSGYGGGGFQTSLYTNVTNGMALSGNNVATDVRNGAITITNITGNTWVSTATNFNNNATGGGAAGSVALSGALNMVRITTVNGTDTYDAGTINILYE